MQFEFDPAKDEVNIAKHGVSLARAVDLEILAFIEDDRTDYGEVRYRAWRLIGGPDRWQGALSGLHRQRWHPSRDQPASGAQKGDRPLCPGRP